MNPLPAPNEMEPPSNAILRHNFRRTVFPLYLRTVHNPPKNWIVRDDNRRRPQSRTEAEIDFAAVLPRSPRLLLAEPIGTKCLRNVRAARRAIVFLSRIPISVIR